VNVNESLELMNESKTALERRKSPFWANLKIEREEAPKPPPQQSAAANVLKPRLHTRHWTPDSQPSKLPA